MCSDHKEKSVLVGLVGLEITCTVSNASCSYIGRKHDHRKPGRYLWDRCSPEELQAQFEMQDEYPIELEHLVYIIMDINVNLRAGFHLDTRKLGKYLKRTRIVVDGLCYFAPIQEARVINTRVAELVPFWESNENVGRLNGNPKVVGRMLNLLHDSVMLFEKHIGFSRFYRNQIWEMHSITLDGLQATPGTGNRNRSFTSTQE